MLASPARQDWQHLYTKRTIAALGGSTVSAAIGLTSICEQIQNNVHTVYQKSQIDTVLPSELVPGS